jgi:hypothetical protein
VTGTHKHRLLLITHYKIIIVISIIFKVTS